MILIRTTQSGHFAIISQQIENLTPNQEPKILVFIKKYTNQFLQIRDFYNNDVQNTKGGYWDHTCLGGDVLDGHLLSGTFR